MTLSGMPTITCSRCGREFPPPLWAAHAHSDERARCVEPECEQFAAGYAIRGMNPLCGRHLVERRRRDHEVRFVDGGVCSVCLGNGQVSSERAGGGMERCSLCEGSGYLDEGTLADERQRMEEEQIAEFRRRSEMRREIERVARQQPEMEALNRRRREEIERARAFEEARLQALAGRRGSGAGGGGAGRRDDGGLGVDGRGGFFHRKCRIIAVLLIVGALAAAIAGAAVVLLGVGDETPLPTPMPEATPTPTPLLYSHSHCHADAHAAYCDTHSHTNAYAHSRTDSTPTPDRNTGRPPDGNPNPGGHSRADRGICRPRGARRTRSSERGQGEHELGHRLRRHRGGWMRWARRW